MTVTRMCIACRTRFEKSKLIRVAKDKNGDINIDLSHRLEGRGAYICSKACIEKCIKARLINRAFKREVDKRVYEELNILAEQKSG